MAASRACLIKYLQRTNFTLFKLTGSCSLQLCHLFGCCTTVLFPFVFQSPLTVSSHTGARDRWWQKGCRSKQVFSHTAAAQQGGQSTKKPPSVPLPRPYHLAASSPTHTNSCNNEPSPTKLSAADCPSHSINGMILPMPRQPESSSFSLSPAPGCWLVGLETQGWLGDPGHRACNCCSRGKGPLWYQGAGNAGGTIPICNSPAPPQMHRCPGVLPMCIHAITSTCPLRTSECYNNFPPISCFVLPANSCHTCPPQGQELVPTHRICSR